jgi:hypothetical protein
MDTNTVKFMYRSNVNHANEVSTTCYAVTKIGDVFCYTPMASFSAMDQEAAGNADNWTRIVQSDGSNFKSFGKAEKQAKLEPTEGQAAFALLVELNAELKDLKSSVKALSAQCAAVRAYRKSLKAAEAKTGTIGAVV